MEKKTIPVGCAERDWVRSKVFTEKLDSYTRVFSQKQNKPPLSFQLQRVLVVESLIYMSTRVITLKSEVRCSWQKHGNFSMEKTRMKVSKSFHLVKITNGSMKKKQK